MGGDKDARDTRDARDDKHDDNDHHHHQEWTLSVGPNRQTFIYYPLQANSEDKTRSRLVYFISRSSQAHQWKF